jgi:hypothetical protein
MKNRDFSFKKGWKLMFEAHKQRTQVIKRMGVELEDVLSLAPI